MTVSCKQSAIFQGVTTRIPLFDFQIPSFDFQTPLFDFQTQNDRFPNPNRGHSAQYWAQDNFFHLGQKQDLLPPQRSWEEPPVTARPAPPGSAWETLPGTIEKLQFVCAYVWTLSMLSCLQVNLSWGVCHGSSWFCI